tara:strand:+ start:1615 stop:1809 length:195 start_codon:yes stop_codon:yes gene_type:complete
MPVLDEYDQRDFFNRINPTGRVFDAVFAMMISRKPYDRDAFTFIRKGTKRNPFTRMRIHTRHTG